MAAIGYVKALLAGFPAEQKRALEQAFEEVLNNLRLGRPEHEERAENLQLYYYEGTTAAVANTEFTIAHGLGRAPYTLIPVLSLQDVNSQIVPLKVTRAADATRIYLSSSETNAVVKVAVEA